MQDAAQCISLRPGWFKGYSRMGAALQAAGRADEAARVYEDALSKVDSGDRWRIEKKRDELARKRGQRQHAMQQPSEPAPELGYYEILNCERDATPVVRESGPHPALAPPTSPPPALTARAAPFRGRQTIKKQYYQLAKVRLRAGPRLRLRLLNASDAGDSRHVPS